jgi:hypothetical protein
MKIVSVRWRLVMASAVGMWILGSAPSKKTMEAAIIEFGRRLAEGGVGAFYDAGHGLRVRGRNYLVPVDAEIDDEASTRVAAVDVELLLEQMAEAKNRVNIVILRQVGELSRVSVPRR